MCLLKKIRKLGIFLKQQAYLSESFESIDKKEQKRMVPF